MTLSDISNIVGMISGLAVLGSLVYLAQQTRQNVRHTMALIQQSRSNQVADRLGAISSDLTLAEVSIRGVVGDQTLSDVQITRLVYWYYAVFVNFEDQFYQHEQGLIDDARYESMLGGARGFAQSPGGRAAWMVLQGRFDPKFKSFIGGLMESNAVVTTVSLAAAWRAQVAAQMRARPA